MIHTRFVLALFVIIMISGQAIAADVKVFPSSYLTKQGETFDLNITIDPRAEPIAGAQLNIEFDKRNIRINNIIEGNFFKQNGASTFFAGGILNNSTGTVINILGVVNGRTNVSNPGTFIIINATAIGSSGISGINLSNVLLGNSYAQPAGVVVYNGSLIINSPAVLSGIGDKNIYEGQALAFTLSATDPDLDTLTYSASNLPYGATFDPGTRTFSWTSDLTLSGIYPNVHFEVSDGTSTDFENIEITVNKRPNTNTSNMIVTPSRKIVNAGQTFSLNITIDPLAEPIAGAQLNIEFDKRNIRINNIDEGNFFKQNGANTFFAGGILNNSTGTVINILGVITGRTNVTNPGTFIIINATAIGSSGTSGINLSNVLLGNSYAQPVGVVVYNGSLIINSPPILSGIGDKNIYEGQALTFTLSATDPDLDTLTYSASNLPDGATFDPVTRTFSWTPDFTQSGNCPDIHFEVSDGSATDIENVMITVNNVYPRYDVDENGVVDIWDLAIIGQYFHETVNAPYPRYDVTNDGVVDILDITITAQHFGENT